MAFQTAYRSEATDYTPDPDATPTTEGPGLSILRGVLGSPVRDPKRVMDLLAAYPGERDAMLMVLQRQAGNAFTQHVLELERMEYKLAHPPDEVDPAATAQPGEPRSKRPLVAQPGPVAVQGEGDANAISPDDVYQGRLGDCWMISAIGAMAKSDPTALAGLITVLAPDAQGQPRYQVTLYQTTSHDYDATDGVKTRRDIVVTARFPLTTAQPGDVLDGKPEIWVQLLEKAFAVAVGSYEGLDGSQAKGLSAFTPGVVERHNGVGMKLDELKRLLTTASAEGRPITLSMQVHRDHSDERLVFTKDRPGAHVFWVDHVDGDQVAIWEGHGHHLSISFAELLAGLWDVDIGPKPSTTP